MNTQEEKQNPSEVACRREVAVSALREQEDSCDLQGGIQVVNMTTARAALIPFFPVAPAPEWAFPEHPESSSDACWVTRTTRPVR